MCCWRRGIGFKTKLGILILSETIQTIVTQVTTLAVGAVWASLRNVFEKIEKTRQDTTAAHVNHRELKAVVEKQAAEIKDLMDRISYLEDNW